MMLCSRKIVLLVLCLAAAFLEACAPSVPVERVRYFFPPSPDVPRIEYIQPYFSDHDLKSTEKSFMTQYVLGEELPRPIFVSPVDVASDGKGRIYVSDSSLREVFVLDMVKREYRPLTPPEMGYGAPLGVTAAANGHIYVVDALTKRISVFDSDEEFLYSIVNEEFLRPTAVAVDTNNSRVYVLDAAGHNVSIFSLQGDFIERFGQRGEGPGEFNFPTDVDVDEAGNIYVLDALNARVQVFDKEKNYLRMFGERGTAEGSFQVPKSLAVSNLGHVYVTDALAHKVVVFSLEGDFLLRIGGKSAARNSVSPGGFYLPRGIAVDERGRIWVVDSLNRMVHRFQFLTSEYLRENPVSLSYGEPK